MAKAKEYKDFGTKMEKASKSNHKLFYRVLKSIRNKGRQWVETNYGQRKT